MSKHTPGPWSLETLTTKAGRDKRGLSGSDGKRICDITVYDDQADANARLIAQAPALLAALRWAVGMAEEAIMLRESGDDPEDTPKVIAMHREQLETAVALIKAAEGR
jgi:hypothetical protein